MRKNTRFPRSHRKKLHKRSIKSPKAFSPDQKFFQVAVQESVIQCESTKKTIPVLTKLKNRSKAFSAIPCKEIKMSGKRFKPKDTTPRDSHSSHGKSRSSTKPMKKFDMQTPLALNRDQQQKPHDLGKKSETSGIRKKMSQTQKWGVREINTSPKSFMQSDKNGLYVILKYEI